MRPNRSIERTVTGTVVNRKIVIEGVPLTGGADESFSLSEAQENALLVSIAEIERGDYVTLEELLA